MKSIVLAAGYATRLYPLTKDFPKPLLPIGNSTILNRLITDIDKLPEITGHIIISNHKFINHFENWKKESCYKKPITILDDGSTENENRLGAVKDLVFALETLSVDDDILVLAGDNVLDFSLSEFIGFHKNKHASCIMRHYEDDISKLRKTGVATVEDDGKVLSMQEKPAEPQSNWAVPPFYIYKKTDIPVLKQIVASGECATDAPGDFIATFCKRETVYAWEMTGKRYDIGDLLSYQTAQSLFAC